MRWDWRSSTGNEGEPATPRSLAEYVSGETHPALARIEVLDGVHGAPVGVWIHRTTDAGDDTDARFDRAGRRFLRWNWIPEPIRRIFPLGGPGDLGAFMWELRSISDSIYTGFAGAFDPETGELTLTCGWGGDPAEHVDVTVDERPLKGTRWSIALDASGLVKGVEVDGFGKCLTDLQRAMLSSEGGDSYFDVPEFRDAVTGYFDAMQLPIPEWLHQPQLRTAEAINQTQWAIGPSEDALLAAAYDDQLPVDFGELLCDVWAWLATGEPRGSE